MTSSDAAGRGWFCAAAPIAARLAPGSARAQAPSAIAEDGILRSVGPLAGAAPTLVCETDVSILGHRVDGRLVAEEVTGPETWTGAMMVIGADTFRDADGTFARFA